MLDKFRELNRFMQKTSAEPVNFDEVGGVLAQILNCNVYVISRKGKVLGSSVQDNFECGILVDGEEEEKQLPEEYNAKLWEVTEPTSRLLGEDEECFFPQENCPFDTLYLAIIPTYGGGTRMGTLVLERLEKDFDEEELVICEYGATVVGLETLRSKSEEQQALRRERMMARVALDTLSYSEMEAVNLLFENFEGDEEILVASEIADQAGLTRSVIVNALRKLESAGVIESRSLGMKGTHIRVLNDLFLEELDNKR